MNNSQSQIFIVRNGCTSALEYRSMRDGINKKKLEAALQDILNNHPAVLSGRQMAPGSQDPPRFILLKNEKNQGRNSLDHLFVDQYAKPTLVETKLFENPEAKREVIGQLIDYAANAAASWCNGIARKDAKEFWNKKGKNLDQLIIDELDVENVEKFWSDFESNLMQEKLRLIIAADMLRPEVRRMIEFLNRRLEGIDVMGLELSCFSGGSEDIVLVPTIIGLSQQTLDTKRKQSEEEIRTKFNELPEPLRDRMLNLLDYAVDRGLFNTSNHKSDDIRFNIVNRNDKDSANFAMTIGVNYLYFPIGKRFGFNEDKRRKFLDTLIKIKLLSPVNLEDIPEGKNGVQGRGIQELSEEEFKDFFSGIKSFFGAEEDGR